VEETVYQKYGFPYILIMQIEWICKLCTWM